MKKLHLYMLKSFIGPFVATFFISMFVLIMQFLWRYIDDLVGKGLDADVIIQLLSYVSLTLVPMGLPLAVLLASIMTFGSLGENYELTALKAAGISLYRIMQPLIVLIIVFTIAAFFFSNNVLPYANLKASTLLYDIKRQKPELSLKEGMFINDIEGYSIKVDKIDKKTGMMYAMLIYSHPKNGRRGNFETTIADSGIMKANEAGNFMEVQLYNGYTYTDEGGKSGNKETYPFRRVKFDKQFFVIPLAGNELQRSDDDLFKDSYGMLNIVQLETAVDSLQKRLNIQKQGTLDRMRNDNYMVKKDRIPRRDSVFREETGGQVKDLDSLYRHFDIEEQKKAVDEAVKLAKGAQENLRYNVQVYNRDEAGIRRYNIEWHRKFTLSFACFIFFFIGAPLGGIIRKGGLGAPVVVSIFLFIMYYIIWMMGERAAREGALEPWQGMWISSVVLLPLGAILTYTAMTDSAVMSSESYMNFIKKIIGLFKKKKKDA